MVKLIVKINYALFIVITDISFRFPFQSKEIDIIKEKK